MRALSSRTAAALGENVSRQDAASAASTCFYDGMPDDVTLHPIGRVASPLMDRGSAPLQPDEDAPQAWLVLNRLLPLDYATSTRAWRFSSSPGSTAPNATFWE